MYSTKRVLKILYLCNSALQLAVSQPTHTNNTIISAVNQYHLDILAQPSYWSSFYFTSSSMINSNFSINPELYGPCDFSQHMLRFIL